jgi:hypothetical protein
MDLGKKNLRKSNLLKATRLIVIKGHLLITKISQEKKYLRKLSPINFKKILMILLTLIGPRELKYLHNSKLLMISWKNIKSLTSKISIYLLKKKKVNKKKRNKDKIKKEQSNF